MTEEAEEDGPKPLLLSADEKRILELYDRLQQLQLEIALTAARKNYVPSVPPSRPIRVVGKMVLVANCIATTKTQNLYSKTTEALW